jgi:hypothetical protein
MNRPLRSGLAGFGLAALFLIMLAPSADASSGRGSSDQLAVRQPPTSHVGAGATSTRAIQERNLAFKGP